jgi:hypothetical protein
MPNELPSVILYLYKSRAVESSGQPQRTDQIRLSRIAGGKSHAHLKRHSRFLGDHSHRPAGSHHSGKLLKQLEHTRLGLREKCFQTVLAAGVPHVFGNEPLPAFRTAPERFEFLPNGRGVILILWTDFGLRPGLSPKSVRSILFLLRHTLQESAS